MQAIITFLELSILTKAVLIRVLLLASLLLPLRLFGDTENNVTGPAGVNLLTSIKPLQLIAQAITHGVVDSEVLLPPGATTHNYALKPSELERVYAADLLLWLGAPHEPYLAKPVAIRGANDLAIMNYHSAAPELRHKVHKDSGHSHIYGDPHVWFSSSEALVIARLLTDTLTQIDPLNATKYKANLALFTARLERVNERIRIRLKPATAIRYLVYHDAYSYFERDYGLAHLAVVTEQPESKPGARSLLELRKKIVDEAVTCLFIEPQSDPNIVRIITENNTLQVYTLDPMAASIMVSETGYEQFLEDTATRFAQCL